MDITKKISEAVKKHIAGGVIAWLLAFAVVAWVGSQAYHYVEDEAPGVETTPQIKRSGKPRGGQLIDPDKGHKVYTMEQLRGNWTLVLFTVWRGDDLYEAMSPQAYGDFSGTAQLHKQWQEHGFSYLHEKLAPHHVKLWVVRMDTHFADDTRRFNGPYDRFFLAAQRAKRDNRYWSDYYKPVRDWYMGEWVSRYYPPAKRFAGGAFMPTYALLDPSGELLLMGTPPSNYALYGLVMRAMGKQHLIQRPSPRLNDAIREIDYRRHSRLQPKGNNE